MDLGLCSVVVFAFGFFEFAGDGLLGLCLYSCWSLGLCLFFCVWLTRKVSCRVCLVVFLCLVDKKMARKC